MLRIDVPAQPAQQNVGQLGFKAASRKSPNKTLLKASESAYKNVKLKDTFTKNQAEAKEQLFRDSIDYAFATLKEMAQKHPTLFNKIMSK
jgi:hypothetical protein